MKELAITDAPGAEVRNGILAALEAYNNTKMEKPGAFQLLVIPIRADDGQVIGGLWGHTWASWLYVDLFVVPETMRKSGLGTQLMRMAEEEARCRGCIGAWLNTFSFQAQPFYEKLGYSTFATLPDFLPGHDRHFMLKRFV